MINFSKLAKDNPDNPYFQEAAQKQELELEIRKRREKEQRNAGRISRAEFDKPRYLTQEQLDKRNAEKDKSSEDTWRTVMIVGGMAFMIWMGASPLVAIGISIVVLLLMLLEKKKH